MSHNQDGNGNNGNNGYGGNGHSDSVLNLMGEGGGAGAHYGHSRPTTLLDLGPRFAIPTPTNNGHRRAKPVRRASNEVGRRVAAHLSRLGPEAREATIRAISNIIGNEYVPPSDFLLMGYQIASTLADIDPAHVDLALGHLNDFAANAPKLSSTGLKRVGRAARQLMESYVAIPPGVQCIWRMGSARFQVNTRRYLTIKDFTRIFTIATYGLCPTVTGGGPGAMEAAAHGAFEAFGIPCAKAFCLKLPKEEKANPYAGQKYTFLWFGPRKQRLLDSSISTEVYPGGMGTLDEMYEVACMMQTGKHERMPMYLIGRGFWLGQIREAMAAALREETIGAKDLGLFTIVDLEQPRLSVPDRHIQVHGDAFLEVIGRREWMERQVNYIRNLHPDFQPSAELVDRAGAAMDEIDQVEVPPTW